MKRTYGFVRVPDFVQLIIKTAYRDAVSSPEIEEIVFANRNSPFELFYYLREHLKYKGDVPGIEEYRAPRVMAREILENGEAYGDCDDFTGLAAAVLLKAGYPVRLVLARDEKFARDRTYGKGKFNHIYVEFRGKMSKDEKPKWIPFDLTVENFGEHRGKPVKYIEPRVFGFRIASGPIVLSASTDQELAKSVRNLEQAGQFLETLGRELKNTARSIAEKKGLRYQAITGMMTLGQWFSHPGTKLLIVMVLVAGGYAAYVKYRESKWQKALLRRLGA